MSTTRFDAFLKRVFESTGITSQTELASALKINRSAITQARKKDSIPGKWILQLYKTFGLNPDWIETGSGRTFVKQSASDDPIFKNIPKVKARLSAGGGSFEVGSEVKGYYAFRKDWLSTKGNQNKMVLMDIFGNSMEPEMKDGDTILIDESQKDIIAGAIYAVGIDDTIMVKRLEKHPNKLVLLSDNKDYAPIYLQNDEINSVRMIGKVIWICRELR
ncbi:MAG: helix-turn-helix transcriptional regulator [Pseudomonadota bacterium]|uniref:Helix-turn-helix transcriptional regulator n=1 Tax=Candidatus Desulfatibia profunda TaxID=2841695 RepID=A0A8J6NW10_9BACT|nr:helix-turn-helix transcriptional regulator [Candidatus Desulfatibia profunda]MBL7179940.1 helix-turn-helix transcriptional regulator [Desulfobacterales bacterium]